MVVAITPRMIPADGKIQVQGGQVAAGQFRGSIFHITQTDVIGIGCIDSYATEK